MSLPFMNLYLYFGIAHGGTHSAMMDSNKFILVFFGPIPVFL